MLKRRIDDQHGDAHFVTFSCYKRRRLLGTPRARQIVISVLASQLRKQNGTCVGFCVMPEHVHALVWFPAPNQLSNFMKQWKQRTSVQIKKYMRKCVKPYTSRIDPSDPVWQARYYDFNVRSEKKLVDKLEYMHKNPLSAKLVDVPADWPHSSARWYERGKSVGVPIGRG